MSTGDAAIASNKRPQQLHRANNSIGNEVFSSRQPLTQRTQDDDYDTLDPVGEPSPGPCIELAAYPGLRSSVQDTFQDTTKRAYKWRVLVNSLPASAGDRTCGRSAGSAPGTPPLNVQEWTE